MQEAYDRMLLACEKRAPKEGCPSFSEWKKRVEKDASERTQPPEFVQKLNDFMRSPFKNNK